MNAYELGAFIINAAIGVLILVGMMAVYVGIAWLRERRVKKRPE